MTLSVQQQLNWLPSSIGNRTSSGAPADQVEVAFAAPSQDQETDDFSFFGEDGFSFGDLIDVINPLQHIPFVSTFYRDATGDDISAGPRVMGSTLFFGPIGLAGALANVVVEENTGMDIGEHMASWMDHENDPANDANTAVASSTPKTDALDSNDPVVAWARQEIDWARRGASEPAPTPKPKATPSTFPDAEKWVQQDQPWASRENQPASAAILSAEARAASWAYEAAASLDMASRS